MSIEVETSELIEQFLKENNLHETLKTLQEESGVSMNMVESVDDFVSQIASGSWDSVISTISDLKIPKSKLFNLYEQIMYEFVEMEELGAARSILRETEIMFELKERDENRYLKLEEILSRPSMIKNVFSEIPKEKRRARIAQELCADVKNAPPGRLLNLINQSLKYQSEQGLLPNELEYDLFRGSVTGIASKEDIIPNHCYATVKFEAGTNAECSTFSPDGRCLLTGSADGFIEVWNPLTGKLRTDLQYQAEKKLMVMEGTVLCLSFTKDGEYFASGSQNGDIYVWKLQSGLITKKFINSHAKGVAFVAFSRDSWEILSTGFDNLIKIFGLKSGKMIREFRGHTSYVNHSAFTPDNTKVISSSSDGTIKIWDSKTADCILTINSKVDKETIHPPTVWSCQLILKTGDLFLVCNQSDQLHLLHQSGKYVRSFEKQETEFQGAALSAQGTYTYAIGSDRYLYCFDNDTGKLVTKFDTGKSDLIGISCHPLSNVIALFDVGGSLKLWKA